MIKCSRALKGTCLDVLHNESKLSNFLSLTFHRGGILFLSLKSSKLLVQIPDADGVVVLYLQNLVL